jgi:hypothetical protein
MKEDPIVEEARRAGQAYINSFNGDWQRILEDLRRRSREAGHEPVQLPPKPVKPRPDGAKKAG